MSRKNTIKIAGIAVLAIGAIAFASAATTTKPDDDILFEAAQKRFKLEGVVAKKDGKKKKLDVAANELKMSYISLLKNQLASEKLKKDPGSIAQMTRSLLAKKPQVVKLEQKGAMSRHALIKNSTGCQFKVGEELTLPFNALSKKLCMDMTFDYPGGFDESMPIDVVVLPPSQREEIPELAAEWEALVSERFKNSVAKEFVASYKQDGRLTL